MLHLIILLNIKYCLQIFYSSTLTIRIMITKQLPTIIHIRNDIGSLIWFYIPQQIRLYAHLRIASSLKKYLFSCLLTQSTKPDYYFCNKSIGIHLHHLEFGSYIRPKLFDFEILLLKLQIGCCLMLEF